jgi:hypothetical protein
LVFSGLHDQADRRILGYNPVADGEWIKVDPDVPVALKQSLQRNHKFPPIELESSKVCRETTSSHRNSLTTVVTDMWEKVKRTSDTDEELGHDIRRAMHVHPLEDAAAGISL